MANPQSATTTSDTFAVALLGELVHCNCMDDAVAIKNSNHLLADHVDYKFTRREIDGMADVLARYGRAEAAETLRRQSCKMRAAQFLLDTIGYERVPHSAASRSV